MKKKIIILILLILVGLAVYYYIHTRNANKDNGFLTIYGNIDIREVNLGFRVPGLVKSMPLEEGNIAKKGQFLAYLDKNQYTDQLNEAQAQSNSQKAELDKLIAGTRVEEIAQARSRVREREATLANAETLLNKNTLGYEAGVVSKQLYDDSITQRKEASAALSFAREELQEALNGSRKEDIQAARATFKASQAKVASLQKTLSYTVLTAPSDGTILTRVKEPGAYVNAGEPVYALAITSPKWVQAYIDEVNLGKIYPGMKAQVKSDSFPDKTYSGFIGFISPTAEFTPKSVETPELRTNLVYRLRVITYDPDNQLRQGMPVTVKVNTKKQNSSKAK